MMLNFTIQPLLARWSPALQDWEHRRPDDRSRLKHEHAWQAAKDLRTALADTQQSLTAYADLLATACGIPNLAAAIPTT